MHNNIFWANSSVKPRRPYTSDVFVIGVLLRRTLFARGVRSLPRKVHMTHRVPPSSSRSLRAVSSDLSSGRRPFAGEHTTRTFYGGNRFTSLVFESTAVVVSHCSYDEGLLSLSLFLELFPSGIRILIVTELLCPDRVDFSRSPEHRVLFPFVPVFAGFSIQPVLAVTSAFPSCFFQSSSLRITTVRELSVYNMCNVLKSVIRSDRPQKSRVSSSFVLL